jgi:hypothetical protein
MKTDELFFYELEEIIVLYYSFCRGEEGRWWGNLKRRVT